MSILPTTHGRWLQVSHPKGITKMFSIPVPSPPPLCGPPWSEITDLTHYTAIYTLGTITTYVHVDLHPYMYTKSRTKTLTIHCVQADIQIQHTGTYIQYLLEKRLHPTGVRSQPRQESDNTGTITNSGKERHKPTTLGEDALKPITLGINAEVQAWHFNWRRQRRELLCNLLRTRAKSVQVKTCPFTHAHSV